MIQKDEVLMLLTDMQDKGIDVEQDIQNLYTYPTISYDTLKKIHDYRSLDLVDFYEKLRKSHNSKKSKLYINIMKSDEIENISGKQILTTLTALLNQLLQFKCEDQISFYKSSRAEEISYALEIYFKTYDISVALKLLQLVKADIIAMEYVNDRERS